MSEARARVDEWAAAGLLLQRGASVDAELLALTAPWLDATTEVLALLPPLGVVADLGRLLTRAPFDIARSEPVADPDLRAAIDAYEEHLLGRLSADYRLELARDALLRLDENLRPAAIAVFVEQVLARVGGQGEFDSPGTAALRRVLHRHGVELVELGSAVLDDPQPDPLRAELAAAYASLARSARRHGALITDVELYTLENHSALRSPSARLAMAQIVEAAAAVERSLPVRVRRSDASRGRTPTRIEDESAYPIGGYASISTIGGIESLVSSELIYMDPPAAPDTARSSVDLFDVRWAAGELLKYTRDESVHTRERRSVLLVLGPDLDLARVKDPQVPWQRLVVLLGGLVAGVRKLCAWLDEAELHLRFLLLPAPPAPGVAPGSPLAPDAALCRLILREYIESGVVDFIALDDADALQAAAEQAVELGGCDLIWLSQGSTPAPSPLPGARQHSLSLASVEPRLALDRGAGPEPQTLRAEGWEAWLQAFGALFQGLV
ncbi:hypothetical protein G6O69_37345 [Pseudenhygromyxa sp. WMMC2535]|uniref:hypothetical protein n=1 Tax=Pseudenhygromyxa sp. WMMC2535 TaxID=2712867 RepID=UPI0015536625|nr:hypothetical protein [Pseudenhygromyxa sp. WMMC2535]NVB43541.1 hypothetical protein [Pseudenhygromyxa sp. WMMC2535]